MVARTVRREYIFVNFIKIMLNVAVLFEKKHSAKFAEN